MRITVKRQPARPGATSTRLVSHAPSWNGTKFRSVSCPTRLRNKCDASSNKCLTSSNKKLLGTSASLLVTSVLQGLRSGTWSVLKLKSTTAGEDSELKQRTCTAPSEMALSKREHIPKLLVVANDSEASLPLL